MNGQTLKPVNRRLTSLGWTLRPQAACVLAFGLLLGLLLPAVSYGQNQQPPNCVPKPNQRYVAKLPHNPGGREMLRKAHKKGEKELNKVSHRPHRCIPIPPPEPGSPPVWEPFNSTVRGQFRPAPGLPGIGFAMPAPSLVRAQYDHTEVLVDGSIVNVYSNELVALDASSPAYPGVRIRESPTLPSVGQTRVTFNPVTGATTAIDSFFDVFTEVSTDGGLTWEPSIDELGLPYSGHLELDEIPEYTFPTDVCPPPGVSYVSRTGEVAVTFANGIKARNFQHSNLSNSIPVPPLGGSATWTAPNTVVRFEYSTDGGATYMPARATANTTVNISLTGANEDTRFFDTEIVALNITGGNLPPGFRLRESPTEVSLGDHTIQTIPGGGFRISSSFLVDMEISTDNGATWSPADGPKEMVLTSVTATTSIPTLSEWGLIILTVLLLSVGAWYLRRQRPGAVLPVAG